MTLQQAFQVNPGQVQSLLDALPGRAPGVVHAIALSSDGLVVAYTAGLDKDHADSLAAIVSGLSSLATGTGRQLQTGATIYTMILMEGGALLVMPVEDRLCLAVLVRPDADIGAAAGELTATVARVGELLIPAAR